MLEFFRPFHRQVLAVIAVLTIWACAHYLNWDWLPQYRGEIISGIWITIWMTIASMVLGMVLATMLGLAQAAGPRWLALPARTYCTIIRGTPLLLQLYLLYYGLGWYFSGQPEIRQSIFWPILKAAPPYGLLALTLSVAGYEGEVMRGAFKGVPHGQLEAARAMGVPRFTAFRRIWLPQALHRALPTSGGETVLQMKSTPLLAMITIMDLYGVMNRVRRDTLLTYEPLLLLALIYLILAGLLVLFFRWLENRLPQRTA